MAERLTLGLVGSGIQRSRTPAMHRAEGAAHGIALDYRLIDTALLDGPPPLADLVARAEGEGFGGLNVTYPFKRAALGLAHEVSPEAREVGAVNTLLLRGGRRIGHNTDVTGFAGSLRDGLPGADLGTVLLLGAGGAGAAVAHALAGLGAGEILVHDRDGAAAARLAASLSRAGRARARVVDDLAEGARAAGGVVNATPMGMAAHPGAAIDAGLLAPRHWVADVVYVPLETPLLAAARALGCATLGGDGMAVGQAVRAFALFTGREASAARMRATFDALGEGAGR